MTNLSVKEAYVKEYQDKIEKSAVVVLTSCEGIKVTDMTNLRKMVRESGAEMRVVKNTLVVRALNNLGMEGLTEFMKGSTAVTFGYDDPVGPVKALFDFAAKAKLKKFTFKAGYMEGKVLSSQELEALSKLPGRKELLGMVASVFQGPIRNIVSVCQAPIRKFVYALDAVREKKEKEAA